VQAKKFNTPGYAFEIIPVSDPNILCRIQCRNSLGKIVDIKIYNLEIVINEESTTYSKDSLTLYEYNDVMEEIEYQLDPTAHPNKVFYFIRNELNMHPLEWITTQDTKWYFVDIKKPGFEDQYFIFNDKMQYTISPLVGKIQPSHISHLLRLLPITHWKFEVRRLLTTSEIYSQGSHEMRLWQTTDKITDLLHKM